MVSVGDRVVVVNHEMGLMKGMITRIIHIIDMNGSRYEYMIKTDPDDFPSIILNLRSNQIRKIVPKNPI